MTGWVFKPNLNGLHYLVKIKALFNGRLHFGWDYKHLPQSPGPKAHQV